MSQVDGLLRFFLPAYLVAYILIPYVMNVWSFKRKFGVDPRVTKRDDPVMFTFQVARNVIVASLAITTLLYAVDSSLYGYLVPVEYLEIPYLRLAGVTLLLVSLALLRVAQLQLKSSYRLGIDRSGTKTDLVTSGLYRWSRNPIALSMTMTAFGFLLVLPTMITFSAAALTYMIFSVRIRIEEEHLRSVHGEAYIEYCSRTRRWI